MNAGSRLPHIDDLLAAYALDAVDEAERAQVEEHLAACESCLGELSAYADAAALMSLGLEQAPPEHVRERLMSRIAEEADVVRPMHRRGAGAGRWLAGVAAAGLLAVGGWGIWSSFVEDDLSSVEQVVQAQDAVRHQGEIDGVAVVVVTSAEQDRAVLLGSPLPEVARDQVYQAWFVQPDGDVVSAGLVPEPGVDAELSGDLTDVTAIALTVEPDGGSEQPTSKPVGEIPLQG